MTEYVKSTNFASKDSLAVGNPLKIVKGTEIDTEFNNIATAVATKADINSPTFTGTPAAPTASAGTNTTQLATTAFVHNEIMAAVYPVGSLYLNATNSTNPATLLGFGTWVAFGSGRVPVGYDAANSNFNSAEKTGGSADATVVSHSHTFSGTTSGQSADHSHPLQTTGGGSADPFVGLLRRNLSDNYAFGTSGNVVGGTSNDHSHNYSGTTASTGSSGTNANLQPYITVYMWKRTA